MGRTAVSCIYQPNSVYAHKILLHYFKCPCAANCSMKTQNVSLYDSQCQSLCWSAESTKLNAIIF